MGLLGSGKKKAAPADDGVAHLPEAHADRHDLVSGPRATLARIRGRRHELEGQRRDLLKQINQAQVSPQALAQDVLSDRPVSIPPSPTIQREALIQVDTELRAVGIAESEARLNYEKARGEASVAKAADAWPKCQARQRKILELAAALEEECRGAMREAEDFRSLGYDVFALRGWPFVPALLGPAWHRKVAEHFRIDVPALAEKWEREASEAAAQAKAEAEARLTPEDRRRQTREIEVSELRREIARHAAGGRSGDRHADERSRVLHEKMRALLAEG